MRHKYKSLDAKTRERYIAELTKNLPKLREKLGISQGILAQIVGSSLYIIHAVERRKRFMEWELFMALAMFFFCQPATKQWVSDNLHPERLLRIDT